MQGLRVSTPPTSSPSPLSLPFESFLLKVLEKSPLHESTHHSVGEVVASLKRFVSTVSTVKTSNRTQTFGLFKPPTNSTRSTNSSISPSTNPSESSKYLPQPIQKQIQKQIQGRALGTDMHHLFQLLKFYPKEKIYSLLTFEERERTTPKHTEKSKKKLREALDYVLQQQNPSLSSLAIQGYVEWGFSFKLQKHTLTGQIDLWGRDEQGQLWIIDYKTGSISYLKEAKWQLKIYALALLACGLAKREESLHLLVLYPQEKEKKYFTFSFEDLFAEESGA